MTRLLNGNRAYDWHESYKKRRTHLRIVWLNPD